MPVREVLKTIAWRAAPEVMAERARDYERALRATTGLTGLAERLADAYGDRVLRGPVAGMRLDLHRLSEIEMPAAKLLGTYEDEIHPALQRAVGARPARFIDLGCADGYFAVGIAVAARVPVDAFDLSKSARALTQATAALNGVENLVTLHGAATTRTVRHLPLNNALILCDIEGRERDLFTRALIDRLGGARVIIELHSMIRADVEQALVNRFGATHHVDVVEAAPRDPASYPELGIFGDDDRDHAVNEMRYRLDGLRWLIAEPN